MSARLSSIVRDYQESLNRTQGSTSLVSKYLTKRTRPLSLYVLTDAVWQPTCNVPPVIQSLVKTLKDLNLHKQQIGIQFIRFGERPEGIKRLEELDKLKLRGFVDMYASLGLASHIELMLEVTLSILSRTMAT